MSRYYSGMYSSRSQLIVWSWSLGLSGHGLVSEGDLEQGQKEEGLTDNKINKYFPEVIGKFRPM